MSDEYDSRHIKLDPHHNASKCLRILQTVGFSCLRRACLNSILKLIGISNLADMAPKRLDLVIDCLSYIDYHVGIFAAPQVDLLYLVRLQASANLLIELQRITSRWVDRVNGRKANRAVVGVVDKLVIDE